MREHGRRFKRENWEHPNTSGLQKPPVGARGGLTRRFPSFTSIHMARPWLRIAHRGASGEAPEHTRPAFVRALDAGVDMIELDVQLSRDHRLVVMHDLDVARTTSGHGPVRDHTLVELQRLDAGGWFGPQFAGESVLGLDEVIEIVGTRARLNVEVKAPPADWDALASNLLGTLRESGLLESTVISCFDMQALAAVRAQAAEARLGVLWQSPDFTAAWESAQELRAASVHPYWMLVSPQVIDAAHARGLEVLTWTVNDVAAMRALIAQGIDGIISDFPTRFADAGDR
jgi:glycerophosphoryl diester phosphodiesterase